MKDFRTRATSLYLGDVRIDLTIRDSRVFGVFEQ